VSERVDIEAELHGVEAVNAGFQSMQQHSQSMSREMRRTASDIAILGASVMGISRLAESFGLLNKQQSAALQTMGSIVAVSSTLYRLNEILARTNLAAAAATVTKTAATIGSTLADWGAVIALKAKAIALAIVNSLSPVGWGILAGAAVAATAGLAMANQIPTAHTGDTRVMQSGIVSVLKDEHILTSNQYSNLTESAKTNNVTINVYGGSTENVLEALRRTGIKS